MSFWRLGEKLEHNLNQLILSKVLLLLSSVMKIFRHSMLFNPASLKSAARLKPHAGNFHDMQWTVIQLLSKAKYLKEK